MRRTSSIMKKLLLFSAASLMMLGSTFAKQKEKSIEAFLRSKVNDSSYQTKSAQELIKEALEACATRAFSSVGVTLFSGTDGADVMASGVDATDINVVAYSPGSSYLAMACSDGGTTAPRVMITFGGNSYYNGDGTTRIDFDTNQGTVVHGAAADTITTLAWSAKNDANVSYLAVGGTTAVLPDALKVYKWDHFTNELDATALTNPATATTLATGIQAAAWSPNRSYSNQPNDPRYLAFIHDAPGSRELVIWRLVNGVFVDEEFTVALAGTTVTTPSIHWHPNGKYITVAFNENAGGSESFEVQTFAFDTDALVLTNPVSADTEVISTTAGDEVSTVQISPDGQYVLVGTSITGGTVGQIQVLPITPATGALDAAVATLTLPNHSDITTAKWSPDGQFIIAAGTVTDEADMKLYTIAWDREQSSLSFITPPLGTEQFSDDGTFADKIKTADWSPNGLFIAIGGLMATGDTPSNTTLTGELDTVGAQVIINTGEKLPGRIYKVTFNEEGIAGTIGANTAFTSGLLGNEKLVTWSGSEAENLVSPAATPGSLADAEVATAAAFSPDSKFIATAFGAAGNAPHFYVSDINVNDITRNDNVGEAAYGLDGNDILAIAWSRENALGESFIAVGGTGTNPIVQVYRFANGQLDTNAANILLPLSSITTHDAITDIKWSPNGKQLAVVYNTNASSTTFQIAIIPFDGSAFGTPKVSSLIGTTANGVRAFSWHPNSKFFATAEHVGSAVNIQGYSFDGVSFVKIGAIDLTPFTTNIPSISSIGDLGFSPDGTALAFGTTTATAGEARIGVALFDPETGDLSLSDLTKFIISAGTDSNAINTIAWSPDGIYITAGGGVDATATQNKLYLKLWNPRDQEIATPSPETTEQFSTSAADSIIHNVWSPSGEYIAVCGDMSAGITSADITLNLDGDIISAGSKLPLRIYNTCLKPGGLINITADSTDFNSIVDFGNNNLFYGTKDGSLWFRRTKSSTDTFGNDMGELFDRWIEITGIPKGSLTTSTNFAFVLRRTLDGRLYVLDKAGTVHRTTSTSTKLSNVHDGSQFTFQEATDANQLGVPVFVRLSQAGNSIFGITADGKIYDYQDAARRWVLVGHSAVSANGKLCVNNNLCFNIN